MIPTGALVKLGLGSAARVVRIVQFIFGKGIPAFVVYVDLTTGKTNQAVIEGIKAIIPGESCIEVMGLIFSQLKVQQVS